MTDAIRIWMDGAGRLVLLKEFRRALAVMYGDTEVVFHSDPERHCIIIRKANEADSERTRITTHGMHAAPRLQLPVGMIKECSPPATKFTQRHVYVTRDDPDDPHKTRFFVWL